MLRSGSVGEQCEALHFFALLLAQFPSPLVASTTFLKLADLFRQTYASACCARPLTQPVRLRANSC